VSREVHAWFCEQPRGQIPRLTQPKVCNGDGYSGAMLTNSHLNLMSDFSTFLPFRHSD
jgi:hypothetical protein